MNSEAPAASAYLRHDSIPRSPRSKALFLGILALLGLIRPVVKAADFAWTGAAGNNWFTPGNWNPNGVPGADDRAILTGGVVTINGAVTVKELHMVGANVRVNSPLLVTGSLNWTRGNLSGPEATTLAEGSISIFQATGDQEFFGHTLTNRGTILWKDGNLWLQENSLLVNEGLIESQSPQSQFISTGRLPASQIINRGTFRHTSDAGLRILAPTLSNEGKVEVLKGSLEVAVKGQSKGEFTCATGASLIFSQGHSFLDGTTFLGSGRTALINAVFYSLNGTISAEKLEIDLASLIGTNQLQGNFFWNRGRFTGPGITAIAEGATLTIQTDGDHEFYGYALTNRGTILWPGGNLWLEENSLLVNEGLFDIQLSQARFISTSRLPASQIINRGTFRKSSEPTVLIPSPRLINEGLLDLQQGVLDLATIPFEQRSGELRLSGGQLKNLATMTLNGGKLTGSGTLAGSVDCNAFVTPGSNSIGSITIQGSLRLRSEARVLVQINGDQSYDRLAVSGPAILDGTLEASLVDDFYPAAQSRFPWCNAATREGRFAAFLFPSDLVGMRDEYLPTAAVIQVINVRPILPVVALQSVDELSPGSIVSTANDHDLPPQLLAYRLTAAPAGLEVDNQGVLRWTPSEAQGPGTNLITVVVTDDGIPPLSATNSFQVAVREVNAPPTLTLPATPNLPELVSWISSAQASDPDLPTNALTFELVSGPPGLTVAPDGTIAWTPTEAQGPSTNDVVIRLTDTNPAAVNATSLSVTNQFLLVVEEVNTPPVLALVEDRSARPGQIIRFTVSATDADLPANPLTFSLGTGNPGASLNAGTGDFFWRPGAAAANTTNQFQLQVSDGSPTDSTDSRSFLIVVAPLAPLTLTLVSRDLATSLLKVTGPMDLDYFLETSTDLGRWTNLTTRLSAPDSFEVLDPDAIEPSRFYRVRLEP